jgi:hypothetical protein
MEDGMLDFTDDVTGLVIGGDHVTGQLYYEDRPQHSQLYADDTDALRRRAADALAQIKRECGRAFADIYPRDAWTLRIHERAA